MGKFFLGLLWLAAATYAGYLLTERSFSFLHEPGFGLEETSIFSGALNLDVGGLQETFKGAAGDPGAMFEKLTPGQQECISGSVDPERLKSVLGGEELKPTPQELLAVTKCLK